MNVSEAIEIAEGLTEAENEEQFFAAWQFLIDTGLVWKLQGWFGRTAVRLIELGHCTTKAVAEISE